MARYAKAAVVLILISAGGFLMYRGSKQYLGSIGAQREAAAAWRKIPPSRSATPAFIPEGTTFSKLAVPRLHKALYIVEGDNDEALEKGPGHVRGSAMPGERGNCVIAGHRDLHFRFLKDVQKGDDIEIQDAQGTFRYKVVDMKVISPTDVAVLKPSTVAELHLITCYPFYFVGHAPKRFVVTAALEGSEPEESAAPPLQLARNSVRARPVRSAVQTVSAHRTSKPHGLTKSEYEKSLEATRALNRAAAASL